MRRAGPCGVVALLACLLAVAGCAGPRESRTALLDGKPVRYALAGEGGPTIVFEAGLGDGMDSWSGIFPQAAALSAAFAYDRPGYGGSVTAARRLRDLADFLPGSEVLDLADLAMGGPAPVDGAAAADRLDRLLSLAGARPPYVLVGHSLGGQYVQTYAARHPGKVAGILLVDARPRRMDVECRRLGLDVCAGPPLPPFLFPPAEQAELAGAAAAAEQVPGPGALGDIPVARLVRGKPEPLGGAEAQALWVRLQREEAAGQAGGGVEVVADAGHYIHHDRPDAVLSALRGLLHAAREGGRGEQPRAARPGDPGREPGDTLRVRATPGSRR